MESRLRANTEITAAGIDGDMHQARRESDDRIAQSLKHTRHLKIVEWLKPRTEGLEHDQAGRVGWLMRRNDCRDACPHAQ